MCARLEVGRLYNMICTGGHPLVTTNLLKPSQSLLLDGRPVEIIFLSEDRKTTFISRICLLWCSLCPGSCICGNYLENVLMKMQKKTNKRQDLLMVKEDQFLIKVDQKKQRVMGDRNYFCRLISFVKGILCFQFFSQKSNLSSQAMYKNNFSFRRS